MLLVGTHDQLRISNLSSKMPNFRKYNHSKINTVVPVIQSHRWSEKVFTATHSIVVNIILQCSSQICKLFCFCSVIYVKRFKEKSVVIALSESVICEKKLLFTIYVPTSNWAIFCSLMRKYCKGFLPWNLSCMQYIVVREREWEEYMK